MASEMEGFLKAEKACRLSDLPDLGAFRWVTKPSPLVLIGQVQRSGGTLLTRLFDGHSQLRVYPHELYWNAADETLWPPETLVDMSPTEAFEQLARRQIPILRRFSESGYNKFGRSRQGDPLPHIFNLALHQRLFSECSYTTRREMLDCYLDSFFAAWLDYQDRYVDKVHTLAFGKRHNLIADAFFADYPDGRLITIVREPSSWLASAQRHQPESYSDLEPWAESAQASIHLVERDPDRVFLTTFERLVDDTSSTMAAILHWLGLPLEPAGVEPTFNGMAVHSNSAFEPQRGIDRSVLARSHDDVPAKAQQIYEQARAAGFS